MYRNFKMAAVPEESKVQYTYLGKSGLRVSNICLGTMTFGESYYNPAGQLDEQNSHKLLNRFVQYGGNFIDTANYYGFGNSEKIIGSWLKGQERDRMVIATKCRTDMDPTNPNACGLGRRHIVRSVEDSLERLKTDYIDLLQTHMWDDAVPLEETLATLNDLVRCGKVRYLGASNVTGWQLQKIVDISEKMGYNPFISLQQQYNLACRESEMEPFQVCKLSGLGVMPYSPLKQGLLTGKLKRGQDPKEGRIAWLGKVPQLAQALGMTKEQYATEQTWAMLDTIQKIAKAKGKTMAQVSLRWLLQKPVVSSVIIGATKMTQMEDNLGAANGWSLTDQEMAELDEASKPDVRYPYNIIWALNATRTSPWNPKPYV